MKNIVLTRVDDRLLHGQVVVSWVPFYKIDEIIIIDDEYASDAFMKELMKESAPDTIDVNVMSVEESADYLKSQSNGERMLILSKNVENIMKLINQSVKIEKLNIGGVGFSEGRKKYVNAIHMSDKEHDMLKDIENKGITVEIQMLPSDKPIKLD